MADEESKSVDVLGLKAYGDALKIATKETFKGAGEFLGRICLPAAEEFGLLLQDRVKSWRFRQLEKLTQKTQAKLNQFPRGKVSALPRLTFEILEKGSWVDDDVIQEAWSGILASSCTEDGKDDSNVVFIALLSQLTGVQLRLLNHCAVHCSKFVANNGLPYCHMIGITLEELKKITLTDDVHRLDRELDHLRALELTGPNGGFPHSEPIHVFVQLTGLALHLFVRAQGFTGSPVKYFDLKLEHPKRTQ